MTKKYYITLGVPEDADTFTIRAAYQKLAMAKHPDRGGSDQEFAAIQNAYSVLMDPEARAQYDAAGDAKYGMLDQAKQCLSSLYMEVLLRRVGLGSMKTTDIIDLCRKTLADQKDSFRHAFRENSALRQRLRIASRRTHGPVGNPVEMAIRAKRLELTKNNRDLKQRLSLLKLTLHLLDDYRYEVDKPEEFPVRGRFAQQSTGEATYLMHPLQGAMRGSFQQPRTGDFNRNSEY